MPKTSFLTKLVVLVMIATLLPVAAFAGSYACDPNSCPPSCPSGTYDCTWDWITASYDNFMVATMMMAAGYTVVACCYD